MVMSRRVKAIYRAFPDQHPPGSQFPQIVLETTDGQTIDTRSFLGQKHFVLFTGAIT
jgi:peroxiredoxin